MFFTKNMLLKRKTGQVIRGSNLEAIFSVVFIVFFISLSFLLSAISEPFGRFEIVSPAVTNVTAGLILIINLTISAFSLVHLKESWRVGIVKSQKTRLVTSGIYSISRNPYFVSYGMMFLAYTILLQNVLLLGLTGIGYLLVHLMVLKEERYLSHKHGKSYLLYKESTPRYLLF